MSDTPNSSSAVVVPTNDPGEMHRESHVWGDRLMVNVGNLAAWLFPILIVAIVAQVFMRKAGFNQAWLDDAQWWMYGFAMLAGFGYAITTNCHVRVDIFHQHYAKKKKSRIECFALGWLLLPFMVMMTDILTHYGWASVVAGEGSDSPNGLHRLYLLKMSLPVLFVVGLVAAWAALYRNLREFRIPTLWRQLLWALPAVWFIAFRASHYILYWYYRFSHPEIKPRRIPREALFEHIGWISMLLVIATIVIAYILSKRSRS